MARPSLSDTKLETARAEITARRDGLILDMNKVMHERDALAARILGLSDALAMLGDDAPVPPKKERKKRSPNKPKPEAEPHTAAGMVT